MALGSQLMATGLHPASIQHHPADHIQKQAHLPCPGPAAWPPAVARAAAPLHPPAPAAARPRPAHTSPALIVRVRGLSAHCCVCAVEIAACAARCPRSPPTCSAQCNSNNGQCLDSSAKYASCSILHRYATLIWNLGVNCPFAPTRSGAGATCHKPPLRAPFTPPPTRWPLSPFPAYLHDLALQHHVQTPAQPH